MSAAGRAPKIAAASRSPATGAPRMRSVHDFAPSGSGSTPRSGPPRASTPATAARAAACSTLVPSGEAKARRTMSSGSVEASTRWIPAASASSAAVAGIGMLPIADCPARTDCAVNSSTAAAIDSLFDMDCLFYARLCCRLALRTSRAAFSPDAPVSPMPGCVPEPQRYNPGAACGNRPIPASAAS